MLRPMLTRLVIVMSALVSMAAAPGAPPRAPAAARAPSVVRSGDSLVVALRRLEAGTPEQGADAALVLGQLHYARGEYRLAAEAFSRAAARLDPSRKPEARYWMGLSWLGLGDPNQARAALEDVAAGDSPRRALAQLGVAEAWELAGRADRAQFTLASLLDSDPGEAGPAALSRLAALADAAQQPDVARKARERLMREYPASFEAAGARLTPASPVVDLQGGWTVELGGFADEVRARSLAATAHRAGFRDAAVVTRGPGPNWTHVVVLGRFGSAAEARGEAERAAAALGVTAKVARP